MKRVVGAEGGRGKRETDKQPLRWRDSLLPRLNFTERIKEKKLEKFWYVSYARCFICFNSLHSTYLFIPLFVLPLSFFFFLTHDLAN